jgi:Immunity protein 61
VELRLPEMFEEWTRTLGYEVTRDGDGLVLANTGGELRYYFVPDPAGVALLRAERAEDPIPVMTAAQIDDVVRFLITVFGNDVRAIHDLPRIRLPFDWSSPAPGFSPVALEAGWTGLRTDASRAVDVAMVDRDVVHPIVKFSYVASATIAQLIASYEDRDGAPLLSEFVGGASHSR